MQVETRELDVVSRNLAAVSLSATPQPSEVYAIRPVEEVQYSQSNSDNSAFTSNEQFDLEDELAYQARLDNEKLLADSLEVIQIDRTAELQQSLRNTMQITLFGSATLSVQV